MVVGVTGGIGSGKSTVINSFKKLGEIAVYIADEEAKKLMNTSEVICKKLIKLFGEDAYKDSQLNRAFIANIVFSDKEKLKKLNEAVHPEVYKHLQSFISENASKDYILYENAILFENNSDSFCDYIITVTANIETRIQRVKQRDNVTSEDVKKRMNNQWSDQKKVMLSNYLIVNDDIKMLESQIVRIHNNLTKKKA